MANQAWQITAPGVLTLNDPGTLPKPGEREVLVRIHAFSLNYRDKLVIEHSPDYPVKTTTNLIPGSDGAGIIEAVGPESSWSKGDRVVLHPNSWLHGSDERDLDMYNIFGAGHRDGTFCRYKLVSDERLVKAPDNLSLEEASTLFTAGVTAYRALFHGFHEMKPGMTVLTQGTGGVSSYGIMVSAQA